MRTREASIPGNTRTHGLKSVQWLAAPLTLLTLLILASFGIRLNTSVTGFRLVDGLLLAAALSSVAVMLWRVWLVGRYRPVESVSNERLPTLTVIVPAYNEGEQVFHTLKSLVNSDYPREKLQIIAVDDGSKDDTWRWIAHGRATLGDTVIAVRCRQNRGKRHALYEGFERATGDVVVTVDSDSEVLADTLRLMASPLVEDARVGAVAGNVRVLGGDGAIARMLDVSFSFSFEFMRASESEVDSVMCCPGALSAYRRELIEGFKAEWLAQTFLGEAAAIGEDRAMTNLVLRGGHFVKFQSNAIVLTEVPSTTRQLSRMFLRWARSNVRESLVLAGFVFGRFRASGAWGVRFNCAWSLSRTLLRGVAFVPTLVVVAMHPTLLFPVFAAMLLWASVPALVYALARGGKTALWAFPYALYSMACLSWIGPWALVTPQRSAWLTRTLPEPSATALEPKSA